MKKLLIIALAGGLTACSSTGDLEVPDVFDKTGFGVGIGAVTGALGGLLLGSGGEDTRNKVLIGAGIGALAGAGVGLYMDNQEKELRAELDNSGVLVTRVNDKIIINLPSNISFGSGEFAVKSEFYPALNAIAKVLAKYDKTILDVNGHTDNVGDAKFNQTLSEKRALNVANYVATSGIDQRRVRIRGFGESIPIANNATEAGRAANRRVEIAIVPLQE
ncbi:MAG: cell envelope biogenesis protein OmpA [Hyphomicrobiales bacterium]|nr:MAG: cell envelope biogenesis protein OmpA [Hyphomicrobiales bacterium]